MSMSYVINVYYIVGMTDRRGRLPNIYCACQLDFKLMVSSTLAPGSLHHPIRHEYPMSALPLIPPHPHAYLTAARSTHSWHSSSTTLGGYNSPLSRLTVRHKITCGLAMGPSLEV